MKNGVECYKDFFPYFKALKTNCGMILAWFCRKNEDLASSCYSDFLQTEKKKKCSISTDFFGVWHFFKKQFSAAWDQKVHSLVWWLFEKKVKIQSNSNTLMYMIQ